MIHNDHRATHRQQGFTLVEIMVVIVILGLLATIVVPSVLRHVGTSEVETARQSVGQINASVKMYYLEKRSIPSLEDLITPNDKGQVYLEGFSEAPTDPWGTPFEIRRGEHPGTWEVVSYGPDQLPDTEDDISSKTLKDKKKK
jgi:general secretion pathway protein G